MRAEANNSINGLCRIPAEPRPITFARYITDLANFGMLLTPKQYELIYCNKVLPNGELRDHVEAAPYKRES